MTRFINIWILLVCAAVVACSCGQDQKAAQTPEQRSDLAKGAAIYKTYCGLCHGDEGEGYLADNANALANQDFLVSVSDEFIKRAIVEGRPNTPMAAYAKQHGGPLDEQDVSLLVGFIRAWQTEKTVELSASVRGVPTAAKELFAAECQSCHGQNGNGGTRASALSLSNPVFLESASDGQIRYAIAKGRRGTPMPAFEKSLSKTQIDDLTALIRSWQRKVAPTNTNTVVEVTDVVINPGGKAPDFPELKDGRFVPAAAVEKALDAKAKMVILDARPPSDYLKFHVPGAIPSPYYDVESVMAKLPKDDTWIISYCGCPHAASGRVMDYLREHGFKNTAVLDEGVFHWRDEGFPLASGAERFGPPPEDIKASPKTKNGGKAGTRGPRKHKHSHDKNSHDKHSHDHKPHR